MPGELQNWALFQEERNSGTYQLQGSEKAVSDNALSVGITPECPPGLRAFRDPLWPPVERNLINVDLNKETPGWYLSSKDGFLWRISRKCKLRFHHLEKKKKLRRLCEQSPWLFIGWVFVTKEENLIFSIGSAIGPQGMRLLLFPELYITEAFCLFLHRYFYIILFITLYWKC